MNTILHIGRVYSIDSIPISYHRDGKVRRKELSSTFIQIRLWYNS